MKSSCLGSKDSRLTDPCECNIPVPPVERPTCVIFFFNPKKWMSPGSDESKSIVSERLAQRSRVATAMINPYLRETNYLDDLKTEDKFLRPKISGFEDPKKE